MARAAFLGGRRSGERTHELLGGGGDGVDHVADAVALEEPVLAARRLVLEVLDDEALEPLHLLVRRPRHLQQRRRHRLSPAPPSVRADAAEAQARALSLLILGISGGWF